MPNPRASQTHRQRTSAPSHTPAPEATTIRLPPNTKETAALRHKIDVRTIGAGEVRVVYSPKAATNKHDPSPLLGPTPHQTHQLDDKAWHSLVSNATAIVATTNTSSLRRSYHILFVRFAHCLARVTEAYGPKLAF
jgi:hypothetical protein